MHQLAVEHNLQLNITLLSHTTFQTFHPQDLRAVESMLQCHGVDAADTFTWSGSHGNCGRGASESIFSVRGAPSWYKKVCRQLVTMLRAVWYDSMRDVSSQSVRLRRRPVTCWWVTLPVVKDFFQASSSTRVHITLLIWAPLTPARPGILYKQRCRAAWRYFELRLEGGEPIDIGFWVLLCVTSTLVFQWKPIYTYYIFMFTILVCCI